MINELDFRKQFGQNLSRLRKQNTMTQFQLAEKINYSDKAVSKWERGESIPDAYTLYTIAELFSVSINELLGQNREAEKSSPEKVQKNASAKTTFVPLISALGVFSLGSIIFFILKNIGATSQYAFLAFLYTVPAAAVVMTVFSSLWWKLKYQCMCVSALIWSTGLAVYFTFMTENFKYIFIPCALLECVCILVYVFVYFMFRKK